MRSAECGVGAGQSITPHSPLRTPHSLISQRLNGVQARSEYRIVAFEDETLLFPSVSAVASIQASSARFPLQTSRRAGVSGVRAATVLPGGGCPGPPCPVQVSVDEEFSRRTVRAKTRRRRVRSSSGARGAWRNRIRVPASRCRARIPPLRSRHPAASPISTIGARNSSGACWGLRLSAAFSTTGPVVLAPGSG